MSTEASEPRKATWTPEQLLATVAVVLFILGAFLAGIFLYRQQQQLDQLARQVTQLNARLAQTSTAAEPAAGSQQLQHLAYVKTTELAARYAQIDTALQGDLQTKQLQLKNQLDGLKQQLQSKQITQDQFNMGVLSIQQSLDQIKQQMFSQIADKLIAVINQLGHEGNYDLITAEDNVILYSRAGLMQDLTDEVFARLQAQLAPAH